MYSKTLVVTRHKALVELLVERGIVKKDVEVVEHATTEVVKGKNVIGILPNFLACEAATLTEIPLKLAPEQRGRELSLDELREVAGEAVTYRVTRAGDPFDDSVCEPDIGPLIM